MTTTINASTSTGLVQTADTSGILLCQSNGKNTNLLAWVNFTGAAGGATINASYNVSSVTRTGTGLYTITFTNAMSSIYYCAAVAAGNGGTNTGFNGGYNITPTTTTYGMQTLTAALTPTDFTYNSAIFLA
jgi:hypothetical protein